MILLLPFERMPRSEGDIGLEGFSKAVIAHGHVVLQLNVVFVTGNGFLLHNIAPSRGRLHFSRERMGCGSFHMKSKEYWGDGMYAGVSLPSSNTSQAPIRCS